jgi:hypothetical protein
MTLVSKCVPTPDKTHHYNIQDFSIKLSLQVWEPGSLMQWLPLNLVPRSQTGTFLLYMYTLHYKVDENNKIFVILFKRNKNNKLLVFDFQTQNQKSNFIF